MFKVLAFAVVLLAAEIAVAQYGHEVGHKEYDYYSEPHYSFAYEVKDSHTGDYKSHKEERKGDHTQGVYTLVEPDGSKRIVEYFVEGKSGFNVKVQREHSKHPQSYKGGYQAGGGYNSGGGYKSGGGYQSEGGYSLGGGSNGGYHGGAVSQTNYQIHTGKSQQVVSYQGQPSYHGSQSGYSNQQAGGYSNGGGGSYQSSYSSHGGLGSGLSEYKSQPAYHAQQSYHGQQSYNHGGSGPATSSVKFSTHGANIATNTYHNIPSKYHH